MYKPYMDIGSIPNKSDVVFVITFEALPLDDLVYPEVVTVFKDFDSVEQYLKSHHVIRVGNLLTSDQDAETKDIKYIENIYEITVFDVITGKEIEV